MLNTVEPVAFERSDIGVNGVRMRSQRLGDLGSFQARGLQHQHLSTTSLPRCQRLLQYRVKVVNLSTTGFPNY